MKGSIGGFPIFGPPSMDSHSSTMPKFSPDSIRPVFMDTSLGSVPARNSGQLSGLQKWTCPQSQFRPLGDFLLDVNPYAQWGLSVLSDHPVPMLRQVHEVGRQVKSGVPKLRYRKSSQNHDSRPAVKQRRTPHLT